MNDTLKRIIWTFIQAFLGAFIAGLTHIGPLPNWTAAKAAFGALLVASIAAGFSALKNAFVPSDHALR